MTTLPIDILPVSPDHTIPNRFKGKTLLITGAARGMGQAAAIRAAREGANVVVADWLAKEGTETVAGIVKEGGHAIFVRTDVRHTADCTRMVEEAVRAFGALHLAINNAGVMDGVHSGEPFDFTNQRSLLPAGYMMPPMSTGTMSLPSTRQAYSSPRGLNCDRWWRRGEAERLSTWDRLPR